MPATATTERSPNCVSTVVLRAPPNSQNHRGGRQTTRDHGDETQAETTEAIMAATVDEEDEAPLFSLLSTSSTLEVSPLKEPELNSLTQLKFCPNKFS